MLVQLALRILAAIVCAALLTGFVRLGIIRWFRTARDHPGWCGTPKSNVEAAWFVGIPTAILLAGAMTYWVTLGWSRLAYFCIGVVAYVLFIPARRAVGLLVGCRAQPEEAPGTWPRVVWMYFCEVWRPKKHHVTDPNERFYMWILLPYGYIMFWPVIVTLFTYEHISQCQQFRQYRLPAWRDYAPKQ